MLRVAVLILTVAGLTAWFQVPQKQKVDDNLMANGQFIRPVGTTLVIPARPVSMAIHPSGKWAYVKENRGLTVIETTSWKTLQELSSSGGASYTGLIVDHAGKRLWLSNAASVIHEGTIGEDGKVTWTRDLTLPKPKIGGEAYPCGMALSSDQAELYSCASLTNEIVVFNLQSGEVKRSFPTDIAPFDCAMANGHLFVSCWGGPRPLTGAKTADSAGTQVEIDDRGIAKGGSLAAHQLPDGKYQSIATGLQPSQVLPLKDGRIAVANANHDTVFLVSPDLKSKLEIVAKPNKAFPFGSAPNALATDDQNLYVACGGNNAVAVIELAEKPTIKGFLPTAWYPSALQVQNGHLYVANNKGTGARRTTESHKGFSVYDYTGVLQDVDLKELSDLTQHTKTVNMLNATQEVLQASSAEKNSTVKPVPVPKKLGDPSVFKHVIYVIKENRTYDQVFGDIKKGDGDPNLCIFGRQVTPNQHALAEEFVLLDNYYCNGVNSADGHAWTVEGNATSHFERSFGGFTRSYPFGDDPLSPSTSGFIWDNVLNYGKSFRNYGEFDYATPDPKGSWSEVYQDWKNKTGKFKFKTNIGVDRLRRYSHLESPGWNMGIPDVLRADVFIKDLEERDKNGTFPNLAILYLPEDHTNGTSPGMPTPRAFVADNDLAVGKVVEAVSKTKFWKETVIFVIEDDPQNGFDHIDGHRSTCLVISPYSRTGKVVTNFYNQTSVLHTMQQILGIPPMNQMDARSPLMTACFAPKPNLAPFKALPNQIPLDELNPSRSALSKEGLKWAKATASIPFDKPDQMDEEETDLFNRAIWYSVKGSKPYPAKWAGAHGKGLKKKGLVHTGQRDDDDDDDDHE